MATVKYTIPIELNLTTDKGILNIDNMYIKNGMLYPLISSDFVISTPTQEKVIIETYQDTFSTQDPNAVWAYPVSAKTTSGTIVRYNNVNTMNACVYNYIRRVLVLRVSEGNTYNHVLYIDPPYGFYDINTDTQDGFVNSALLIENCVDSVDISPEGQIIQISNSNNNVIYAIYQVDKFIIIFSNKGIYYLSPIEDGFFEVIPFPNIASYDIKSCIRSFAYNDIVWFLFNNELYVIEVKNTPVAIKIGGERLISELTKNSNDTVYLFGLSDSCVISNLEQCKSILYSVDYKFSGICDICYSGIKNGKYCIRAIREPNYKFTISIRNEINDARFKRLKAVIVKGSVPYGYATIKVFSNINPNTTIIENRIINQTNIVYFNIVFTKLDLDIYIPKDKPAMCVDGIEIYYDYVEKQVSYRYEKLYVGSKQQ